VAPPTSAAQIAGGGAGATPVRVPFTLDGHLPAFDVKINGQGPFRVSLDTGMGGQLSVGRELAETLKLQKVGEARIADPSGQNASSRDLVRVDSVDIGGMQFKGLEATVRDGERPDRTAVAMLGYELFKDVLLTLDYRKGEIAIARGTLPRPDGKEVLALVKGHPVPVIELTLGGKKVLTDIDAGSPALLTVPLAVSKELALKGEPQIVGHGRTASGPMDILAAELAGDVTIGPRTLHDPRLDIIERFPRANLGYRFLRDLAVTFDTKHGRVAFR
jgi:predicted aspartyl protease